MPRKHDPFVDEAIALLWKARDCGQGDPRDALLKLAVTHINQAFTWPPDPEVARRVDVLHADSLARDRVDLCCAYHRSLGILDAILHRAAKATSCQRAQQLLSDARCLLLLVHGLCLEVSGKRQGERSEGGAVAHHLLDALDNPTAPGGDDAGQLP